MRDSRKRSEAFSKELNSWFERDGRWKTKKAFAEDLGLSYNSVKKYFEGWAHPGPSAGQKLYATTGIASLAPATEQSLFEQSGDVGSLKRAPEEASARQGPPLPKDVSAESGSRSFEDPAVRPLLMSRAEVDETPWKTVRLAVSGDVTLRRLEVELIDTRVFQRLRSVKELGTSYLVYPSATHTRFEHSLGTLFEASTMVHYIKENPKSSLTQREIRPEHERLIRLAALLHDLSHIPFGHTLEDEAAVIRPKHDEDPERLRQLLDESEIGNKLISSIGQEDFGLLKKILKAKHGAVAELGELAFISDIVNNTVCADLLDYLKRDVYFCGLQEGYGDRFLRYLYLDNVPNGDDDTRKADNGELGPAPRRLIVRLWKSEASRHRRDILSELIRLLQIRYSLAEKVYFHHAKASTSAMISRAVWAAMHTEGPVEEQLGKEELYRIGDDQLLARLEASKDPVAGKLAKKLLRRDLLKQVYTLPRVQADAAQGLNWAQKMVDDFHENPENRTKVEDQLADLCGLEAGDVLIYCPSLDMAKKYAEMLVNWKGDFRKLKDVDDPATEPALKAVLKSHDLLWGLRVFATKAARDDRKTYQKLRGLCSWQFDPFSQTQDRDDRLENVLRILVGDRVGERGSAAQVDEIVNRLPSKHRAPGGGGLTSADISRAVDEVLGPK